MLEVMLELLANQGFVISAMAVLVCAFTQLFKIPIKAISKRVTKTEKGRSLVNSTILLLPFLTACLLEWLYTAFYLEVDFNLIEALSAGTGGISLYAVFEQVLKKGNKAKNTTETNGETNYDTKEGKAVLELVDKVSADGKVDKDDIDAVKDFWNTINK